MFRKILALLFVALVEITIPFNTAYANNLIKIRSSNKVSYDDLTDIINKNSTNFNEENFYTDTEATTTYELPSLPVIENDIGSDNYYEIPPVLQEWHINNQYSRNSSGSKNFTDNVEQYRDIVVNILTRNDYNHQNSNYYIDPNLILAIIQTESNGNKEAVSISNARGLMQIIPSWHSSDLKADMAVHGIKIDDVNDALFNEFINIDYGILYYSQLLDIFKGDKYKAIQSYNMGDGAVKELINTYDEDWINHRSEKRGDPKYLEKVLQYYEGR